MKTGSIGCRECYRNALPGSDYCERHMHIRPRKACTLDETQYVELALIVWIAVILILLAGLVFGGGNV